MSTRDAPARHTGATSAAGGGNGPRTPGGPAARLLDRAITIAATRAGAPGRIRFTERQLYYETCRVLRLRSVVPRRLQRRTAPPIRPATFADALAARGGDVPGLLPEPVADRPSPAAGPPGEADLYDYGLPRLLVCQSRSIARMLVANHVHLEAACPVLAAEDDLPLDARILAAVRRAGDATVHVLHDASLTGVALPGTVRALLGPLPGVRVSSLGLVPRHATALHLMVERDPAPAASPPMPAGLRPKEIAWLADGRYAQVAAVRPARLLRAVLRRTRGPRPPRTPVRTDLRDLRTAGFLTWPVT